MTKNTKNINNMFVTKKIKVTLSYDIGILASTQIQSMYAEGLTLLLGNAINQASDELQFPVDKIYIDVDISKDD